jgi:hypothetical protein
MRTYGWTDRRRAAHRANALRSQIIQAIVSPSELVERLAVCATDHLGVLVASILALILLQGGSPRRSILVSRVVWSTVRDHRIGASAFLTK